MDHVFFGSAQLRFLLPNRQFGAAPTHTADLLQYTADHFGARSSPRRRGDFDSTS
jgi:hypothetical protein